MRRLAFSLLLLLAACGREAPAPEVPDAPSFRESAAPIGSTTRGSVADLAGDWVIGASYPGTLWAEPGTGVAVEPAAGGGARLRFAGPGGTRELTVASTLPGRLTPAEGPELWVIWVDDDFRTAVVGTPDGRFGWIMDRPGQASPDRTRAAREILEFSGYDLGRLVGPSRV